MDEQTKKKNEINAGLDAWDDFIGGAYLKPLNVESEKETFFIQKVDTITRDTDEKSIQLTLEKKNKKTFLFDLNKTNIAFLMSQGVDRPTELQERSICFRKVLVRNPKTNQEVEGLRISKLL